MGDEKSISTLIEYLKNLEDEIRDIRQRLQIVERSVWLSEWSGTKSTKSGVQLQKIDSVSKELVNTIKSAKVVEKFDPIHLLVIPEVPLRISDIKTVLTQLN